MTENVVNEFGNTSGLGKNSIVPEEVANKFNWGAFVFNWIWAIVHKSWIGLLVIPLGFLPDALSAIACLGFNIWLGVYGNKLAWQNVKWKNIEYFHYIQKRWAWPALAFLIVIPLIACITLVFMNATAASEADRGSFKYRAAAQKAYTTFENAFLMADALDYKLPNSFNNGEELINYASELLRGNISGNKIILSYGEVCEFFAKGDCTANSCYVIVDANGSEGPNKMWTNANKPSDRVTIYIQRINENGRYRLKAIEPKPLAEYKAKRNRP